MFRGSSGAKYAITKNIDLQNVIEEQFNISAERRKLLQKEVYPL